MFVLIGLHQLDIAVAQSNYHNVAASPLHFWEVSVNILQLKHIEYFKIFLYLNGLSIHLYVLLPS
jgi:hypothetical protein